MNESQKEVLDIPRMKWMALGKKGFQRQDSLERQNVNIETKGLKCKILSGPSCRWGIV